MSEQDAKILRFTRLSLRAKKGLTPEEVSDLERLKNELAGFSEEEIFLQAKTILEKSDSNFKG